MANLASMTVAILVTGGFEQVERVEPRKVLDEAGADTRVVSPKAERARGWNSRTGATRSRSTCPSIEPARRISTPRCCRAAS
jgi:putative intracellular protease/amidase